MARFEYPQRMNFTQRYIFRRSQSNMEMEIIFILSWDYVASVVFVGVTMYQETLPRHTQLAVAKEPCVPLQST